jgi:hypothetical protein
MPRSTPKPRRPMSRPTLPPLRAPKVQMKPQQRKMPVTGHARRTP